MRTNSYTFLLLFTISFIFPSLGSEQEDSDTISRTLIQDPPPFTICSKNDCTVTSSSYQQTVPAAQGLEDGGFLLVWRAKNVSMMAANIYGKIYNSNRTSRTPIFEINNRSRSDATNPVIALFPNNTIFVAWVVGTSLYGCIIDPNGTKVGADIPIAIDTGNFEQKISLTVLKDGRFGIFYGENVFVSNTTGKDFKRINYFKIDRDTSYSANYQSIVPLESGGFAIFYTQRAILCEDIYGSDTVKVGNTFIIGNDVGYSMRPEATVLSNDYILVVWSSNSTPSSIILYGQIFTQDGDARSIQFKVASGKDIQPAWVLSLTKKEFVATWFSPSTGMLYGQQFKSDGSTKTSVFTLSSTFVRDTPYLTTLKDDSYIAVSTALNTGDLNTKLIAWAFNLPVVLSSSDDDNSDSSSSGSSVDSNSTSLKKQNTSSDSDSSPKITKSTETVSSSSSGNNVGLIVGVSLGCIFFAILVYCVGMRIIRRRRRLMKMISPEIPLNAVPKLQHENSLTGHMILSQNNNTTIAIQENGGDIGDSVDIKIPFEQQICVLPDNSAIYLNALDLSSTSMMIRSNPPDFQREFRSSFAPELHTDFAPEPQAEFAPALDPQDARDFILDGRLAKPHLRNAYQVSESKEYNHRELGININNEEIIQISNMQQSVHFEPAAFRSFINEGKFAPPIEAVKEVRGENVNDLDTVEIEETNGQEEERKGDIETIDGKETEGQNEERKDDDSNNNKMCIICEDETSVMVFLDCMHICTCQTCSVKVKSSTNQCPICRERIRDIRKVYVI